MPRTDFRTPATQTTYRKTEFIDFTPGQHIIRILGTKLVYDTHYVRGVTFECPGDDCPICKNNTVLRSENPNEKNPSAIPGYITRRQVGYMNVLDRTPAKICPNCGAEVKKVSGLFPGACPKCNASITMVKAEPLNKVKVVSKGKLFFDQIDFHNATTLDEETQSPLGVENFDLGVMVMGGKTVPAITPLPERNDAVSVDEESLFDLERAIVTLNPEEVMEVYRGVRLTDIFAARRASQTAETTPVEKVPEKMMEDMENLFNN